MMRSEQIESLLASLKEMSITESRVLYTLQKIRSDAMATKGGVQRLVRLACVPRVLKLLYHYVSMDLEESEDEKAASQSRASLALSVVANLLNEKEARQQVKRDGVETLVSLLDSATSDEVKLRCCRSMSNLAVDTSACTLMVQAKAVPALINVLKIEFVEVKKPLKKSVVPETPESSPKDASANDEKEASEEDNKDSPAEDEMEVSADDEKVPVVDSDDDCDVEIETKFPSFTVVEAACRVVRCIARDSKARQQLTEEGVVMRLVQLMKSDDSRMFPIILKTLSELWLKMNRRITEKMADEAAAGGIVPRLLELVDSEDDKLSLQAYTVLLPLTCHPRSAAIVGNSGGIDFFLSHLDSPRKHIVRKELISGLCQLAKEGVNRLKLRDSNGWKVFLETLQDDSLVDVQDRVISCLVSFLYDDKTLSLMLEDGLVNILLTHLQRCGNYMSDFSVNLFRNAEMLLKPEASKSTTTVDTLHETSLTDDIPAHKDGSLADDTSVARFEKEVDASDRKTLEKDSELAYRKIQSEPALDEASTNISQAQTLKNANTAVDHPSDNEELQKPPRSQSPISLEEENKDVVNDNEREDKTVDDSRASRTHVYSMNSPTYQAETTWRMEDYHPGVTRKTYHHTCSPGSPTTGSDESRSPPHFPCSPLSMQSYISPSHSDHLSPQSCPASSPAYSYSTLSPVHSPSVSQGCASPAYSSAASSDDLPSFNHQPRMSSTGILSPDENTDFYVFSSSEDDDEEDVEKETDNDEIVGTSADGETQSAMEVRCQLGKDGTGAVDPRLSEEKTANHSTNFLQDFGEMFGDCKSAEQGSVEKIQTGPRFFKVQDADSSDSEPVVKKQKLQPSAGAHASITQNNILMLLSRLSVRDDMSHHFASYKVIQCLIDHLAFADELHYRCARILSRVMSSPNCFSSLLKMCAPAVLIKTFMLDSDLKLFSQETIPNNQVSRHLSLEEKNTRSLMLSGSRVSRSLSMEPRFSVTKSQSNAGFQEDSSSDSLESGKSITHRRFSSDPDKPDPGIKTEEQGSQLASNEKWSQENLAKIGRTLLQDLSAQALSPYSEGVILHTFSCMSAAHQLMCAASILFLMTYCPREKRQKLLVRGGALEKVVSALCIRHSGDPVIKDVLGLGLIYLSRTLNFTPKFDTADLPRLLNQALKCFRSGVGPVPGSAATSEQMATSPNREVCSYNGVEKDLKIIVRKRESCHVLHANREKLVRNSPVFAAMLQGSYIESTQSEISITGVCPKAITVILHYLHCCDDRCCVLKSLGSYTDHVNDVKPSATKSEPEENQPSPMSQSLNNKTTVTRKRQLKFLLNTIAAADRFLLPEMVQYLCSVVSTSLMDERCAEEVLRFATLHGLSELAEDCLQVFLSSVSSVAEGTAFLMALAEGDSSSVVHATLVSLFKRGVANTP